MRHEERVTRNTLNPTEGTDGIILWRMALNRWYSEYWRPLLYRYCQ